MKHQPAAQARVENIYQLDGRVPIGKAIPFGLQHVLAMFVAIVVSGVTMLARCRMDQRNTLIVAASFCIGIGVTRVPGFFARMPRIIADIFQGNPVAGVFAVAMIMSLALPKDVRPENIDALTAETIGQQ